MSCSKPLPPFVCDSLYYLNRDRLERFLIVCRPMKNFIERYLHSKPYRVFDEFWINGGSYALFNNGVQWHPNRDDYSVQQFLAGQICSIDNPDFSPSWADRTYYSFAEMHPYLGPTIRIKKTFIDADGDTTYNSEHIAEMESISYLWRDDCIWIFNDDPIEIVAEDFLPILNSPTILQCKKLEIENAHFSFKDYKVLYKIKVMEARYYRGVFTDPNYWPDFLEQPGVKPIVAIHSYSGLREEFVDLTDRLKKAFLSATVPNAFKIVFIQDKEQKEEYLAKFRETNKTTSETLELKKGLPVEYQKKWLEEFYQDFYMYPGEDLEENWFEYFEIDTLARSSI
ncbi:hypothetical protein DdX_14529 [Ditylenchus destructor]|uniref:Uncharacterized protein n=1 Tax=Ditylenchus destructor TaxID=166010 RepID=A0AAD4MRQ5_9BILA|nr:hypothetical protein DdX_14529 [Ditylenchus destructor]